MTTQNRHIARSKSAFTLIEIITTVMIFSVLMIAVSMLLQNAIRLRDQAQEMSTIRETRAQAKSLISRDLVGIVPTNNVLSGWLVSQYNVYGRNRQDVIEMFTTTGILSQGTFLSEVQKVVYTLVQNENEETDGEYSLVRYIYRHILTDNDETPVQNIVMKNVHGLAFEFYNGDTWETEWDTDEQDPPMPEAIKVSIAYAEHVDDENLQSLEFLVPVQAVAYEQTVEEDSETGESGESTQDSNQDQQSSVGGGINTGGNRGGNRGGNQGGGNQGRGQGGGQRGGQQGGQRGGGGFGGGR